MTFEIYFKLYIKLKDLFIKLNSSSFIRGKLVIKKTYLIRTCQSWIDFCHKNLNNGKLMKYRICK